MQTTAPLDPPAGLTSAEAEARLLRDGPNALPPADHKSILRSVWEAAGQPMVLLLLACTVLYALLGSLFDSAVLSVSIVAVTAISVIQERRTQRVLEALKGLASPRCTVVRDGRLLRIASRDLVVGDRLLAQEGDRLACDARLVEVHALRIDESLLTGESVPIDKAVAADADMLYAGTLVVQGDGVAIVTATGARTALGKIGGSLASVQPRVSRLHLELKRMVRAVAILALVTCLIAATLFALREGSWSAGLLVGLTLAMSIVPEEFAVVWTVMLALGAWRLAQQKVLTRQPQAIEALGSTTVLCVDKTGTLTCNRMAVAALFNGTQAWLAAEGATASGFDRLLRGAALASVREGLEPMDQAIFRADVSAVATPAPDALLYRSVLAPRRPFVVQGWRMAAHPSDALPEARQAAASEATVAIKGAPEAVLARCGDGELPAGWREHWLDQARRWGEQGLRVIAVAVQEHHRVEPGQAWPETGFVPLGLIGFLDPLRDDVLPALEDCRRAGLRVVMITGDGPATALAIAQQAGLARPEATVRSDVLTGLAMDGMNEAALELAVRHVAVFARVAPAQKLRIVQALQRRGEVVAMTGDGVNDGPALRAADIGVAMGERGTDVAREAASLVLLDDRFGSLVEAVRAGRRIFVNLQHALGYLFAVHVPIVGLSLLPLFGGPVLLLPIHVVLLELIIDPACSLVFEAEPLAADGMRRPPRPADAPLFTLRAVVRAMMVGMASLASVVLVHWIGRRNGAPDDVLRLAALSTIVVGNVAMLQWFLGGLRRAGRPNSAFHGLVLGIGVMVLLITLVPALRGAMGFPVMLDPVWGLSVALPAMAWAGWRWARLRVRPHVPRISDA
ncbi:cation-translocating P-type ATPase [Ideonella sp. DXS29W]|uniref:Cation-translocating P-type ATPase n=1 Tax=Ideonella lacteola TaxID=2984193 RepID=A0ABU9C210_9BURK